MDKRILVVDDEQAICELMTMVFVRIGWKVITAANAKDAIAVAKTEMFPVMFIDLSLPDINGINLYKTIKALNSLSVAYLITGYVSDNDLRDCHAAGFRDCFIKPISLPLLVGAAQLVFRQRTKDRQLELDAISNMQ